MNYKFELLQELCDICKDNDIDHFVYGSQMQAAYEDGEIDPEWDSYDIAVTAEGFCRLQNILTSDEFVAAHPNRAFESLHTNPHFPGFFANYVATDSLHFDFKNGFEWYQNKGHAIHILIIVNKGSMRIKPKIMRHLRRGYIRAVRGQSDEAKEIILRAIYKVIFAVGGRSLKLKLFDDHLKCWESTEMPSGLFLADGRYVNFLKDFWAEGVEKTLGGVTFTFPQICLRRKVFQRLYNLNVLHADTIGYDGFVDLCRSRNIDLERLYRERKKERDSMLKALNRGRASKRYYNSAFYGTMIRGEVGKSVDMCKNRSLDSPEYYEIIEEYLENLIKQYNNGFTPYVTFDIFMDAMRVYLIENKKTYKSRDKVVYRTMIKYVDEIPSSHFRKSSIIPNSCYSEEELGKSESELRAALEDSIHDLVLSDSTEDEDPESLEN